MSFDEVTSPMLTTRGVLIVAVGAYLSKLPMMDMPTNGGFLMGMGMTLIGFGAFKMVVEVKRRGGV